MSSACQVELLEYCGKARCGKLEKNRESQPEMHTLHICVCSHSIQTVETFGGGIQAPGVLLYIWLMAF